MSLSIEALDRRHRHVYTPPPDLTVSQWADEYRRLSPEASAEPGRWNTDRAPYQRGILDALNEPGLHTIVVMSSAQVGKTELLLNVIGYYAHQDPSPILLLQPTLDMAEAFSKDRLAPMVRDTPSLRALIADPRSRDSGNTLLHKKFPGGHITMAGSNSPASLASRPIRVVLCDEVDRYPASAAAEGDPVNLARKRTATFHNRRVVLVSTPTLKGLSRIETAYEQSDRRQYMVPCSHCGEEQALNWKQVVWPEGKPSDAVIACQHCGSVWSEPERLQALQRGRWVARGAFDGVAGFHLSELYSPWSSPASMARGFLEAKAAGTELLKTWVNTSLGETWEDEGETVEPGSLMARREDFGDAVPAGVIVLTMGVDVQQDRLEAEIVGWGEGQESWSVDYEILMGDPTRDEVWEDLADIVKDTWRTADGRELSIALTVVDSGYLPERVYAFCRKTGLHVVAGKGVSGAARPVVETGIKRVRRQIKNRRAREVKPELIGVDEAKEVIYRRLQVPHPGSGYCHFPAERDAEYFAQLTGEKLIVRYHKGVPRREWHQMRSRVESLDCRVYAYAALLLYGVERVKKRESKGAPRSVVHKPQPSGYIR